MTRFTLGLLTSAIFALSACSDNDAKTSKTDMAKIEAKAEANIAEMNVGETIDYLNLQAGEMTDVLKSVTDESSAKAAIEALRQHGPKLKAAFASLETIDESDISFGIMRKLPKLMQTQAGLLSEVARINEIPEAKAVMQTELDKLNLGDLKIGNE